MVLTSRREQDAVIVSDLTASVILPSSALNRRSSSFFFVLLLFPSHFLRARDRSSVYALYAYVRAGSPSDARQRNAYTLRPVLLPNGDFCGGNEKEPTLPPAKGRTEAD